MKRIAMMSLACMMVFLGMQAQSERHFWLGADISGTTELESRGIRLYNQKGEIRECTALMKEIGLDAVRLRVWVNPRGGFCSKEDVLQMALRAKYYNMAVMVDFHYSDWWADPGKQHLPAAWQYMSFGEVKYQLAEHTRETLQLLKDHGVEVRWVQIGNETTHGFLWPIGRAEDNMKQYAELTDAGYEAAKSVYPETTCIVHLDGGCDLKRYEFIFEGLRNHGARWDMIGMSVYPYWDIEAGLTLNEEETFSRVVDNIKVLKQRYGTDIMITETGFDVRKPKEGKRSLARLIDMARRQTDGICHGVFYWAPELEDGAYWLGAFNNRRPTAIMEAFSEASK